MNYTLNDRINYINEVDERLNQKQRLIILQFLMYFNVFESKFFKQDKIIGKNANDEMDNYNTNDTKENNKHVNHMIVRLKLENFSYTIVRKRIILLSDYNFFAYHFFKRYDRSKKDGNERFENLGLTSDIKNEAQELLKNAARCTNQGRLLYCYLCIAYRFRNNLFHGSKGVEGLGQFSEEFEKINLFMSKLMSDLAKHNFNEEF